MGFLFNALQYDEEVPSGKRGWGGTGSGRAYGLVMENLWRSADGWFGLGLAGDRLNGCDIDAGLFFLLRLLRLGHR